MGKRRLMRSPRNSLETGEIIALPENGADVYLTINHYLQAITEEELAKGVKKAKAKGGWAVMMEPRTGEILAMAQYPFFDPRDYTAYFNDPLLIEHSRPKTITDAYEPGSIMKPITVAIALLGNEEMKKRGEKQIFDPSEKMDTSKGNFPGRSKPLNDTHFHHYLDMNMALQHSSNIYPARLVERIIKRLGGPWYRNILAEGFGFGRKTGIELFSETNGLLPTIGKSHPNGTPEWSKSTPYSLAIGYNIQANSIQLVRALAVLVNGGVLVQPTLIRKIIKRNGAGEEIVLLDNTQPKRLQQFPRVFPTEICDEIAQVMKYTTKKGGSARRAEIWGYTEGGKSGTAKKLLSTGTYSETAYRSSFIGFAPAKHPAFVLLVTMDEPEYGFHRGIGAIHHGGVVSAPVFREIAKRSLEYMGIPPDDPFGYPSQDPRFDATKADWIPESRRLQEMYEKWNNNAH